MKSYFPLGLCSSDRGALDERVVRTQHGSIFTTSPDIGVRGSGYTLAEAFEQAALAMTAVIVEPDTVAGSETIELNVSAPDEELLLTEWLNALIYEMATQPHAVHTLPGQDL